MKKKLTFTALILIFASLLLFACSGSKDEETPTDPRTSAQTDTTASPAATVTEAPGPQVEDPVVTPLPNGDPDPDYRLPNGDPDPDAVSDTGVGSGTDTTDTSGSAAGTTEGSTAGTTEGSAAGSAAGTSTGKTGDESGMLRSHLTGEIKAAEVVNSRPLSIIFNNLEVSSPQSGIGDASILYEALAEGGITRLMGIFEGLSGSSSCSQRIGSVRSARHYFVSVADEYDSIMISYGATTYADKLAKKIAIDYLTGTTGYGVKAFYRDETIAAPHNAFTSVDLLSSRIAAAGFRTVHEDNYENCHYTIAQEASPNSRTVRSANEVDLDYSSYICPVFKYDKETGLYTRYQFGKVHTDANTGNPLTFSNIIIQIVHEYNKDDKGYQEIDLDNATGVGYYITMGKYEPITWKKDENLKTCTYYDSKGNILCVNPGKTFISIFPDYRTSKLAIQ